MYGYRWLLSSSVSRWSLYLLLLAIPSYYHRQCMYTIYLKLLTTLTYIPKALLCSMSLTTLASIHQYIHTSISNINKNSTATHTLTCNMINNNITCNIIKRYTFMTYNPWMCTTVRCASKYLICNFVNNVTM